MAARSKWLWGGVCGAAILALVSIGDARGFRHDWRLRQDVARLTAHNHQLAEQNTKLAHQIEGLRKDPRALERAAREELGFVKPGEVVINLE